MKTVAELEDRRVYEEMVRDCLESAARAEARRKEEAERYARKLGTFPLDPVEGGAYFVIRFDSFRPGFMDPWTMTSLCHPVLIERTTPGRDGCVQRAYAMDQVTQQRLRLEHSRDGRGRFLGKMKVASMRGWVLWSGPLKERP